MKTGTTLLGYKYTAVAAYFPFGCSGFSSKPTIFMLSSVSTTPNLFRFSYSSVLTQIADVPNCFWKSTKSLSLNVNRLSVAIIKTGLLRTTDNIKPRSIKHVPNKHLKAVFLNHAAEDIYKYNFADVLVSIGDDTTLLSSDILYRFNIPIIGITDGDLDKVVLKGFKLDESLIIQLPSGYDDKVGAWIHEKIFNNEESIEIRSIDNLKEKVLNLIDKSGLKFKIVDKQL